MELRGSSVFFRGGVSGGGGGRDGRRGNEADVVVEGRGADVGGGAVL